MYMCSLMVLENLIIQTRRGIKEHEEHIMCRVCGVRLLINHGCIVLCELFARAEWCVQLLCYKQVRVV
jgi:hypothetical protein